MLTTRDYRQGNPYAQQDPVGGNPYQQAGGYGQQTGYTTLGSGNDAYGDQDEYEMNSYSSTPQGGSLSEFFAEVSFPSQHPLTK